jgi:RecG-like helicase
MTMLTRLRSRREEKPEEPSLDDDWTELCRDTVPIAEVEWRSRAKVAGRVRSVRVQPWAGVPTLECVLVDETGGIGVVFLGRRQVAGVRPGTRMVVEGMVGDHAGHMALLNPEYRLLATPT